MISYCDGWCLHITSSLQGMFILGFLATLCVGFSFTSETHKTIARHASVISFDEQCKSKKNMSSLSAEHDSVTHEEALNTTWKGLEEVLEGWWRKGLLGSDAGCWEKHFVPIPYWRHHVLHLSRTTILGSHGKGFLLGIFSYVVQCVCFVNWNARAAWLSPLKCRRLPRAVSHFLKMAKS